MTKLLKEMLNARLIGSPLLFINVFTLAVYTVRRRDKWFSIKF